MELEEEEAVDCVACDRAEVEEVLDWPGGCCCCWSLLLWFESDPWSILSGAEVEERLAAMTRRKGAARGALALNAAPTRCKWGKARRREEEGVDESIQCSSLAMEATGAREGANDTPVERRTLEPSSLTR